MLTDSSCLVLPLLSNRLSNCVASAHYNDKGKTFYVLRSWEKFVAQTFAIRCKEFNKSYLIAEWLCLVCLSVAVQAGSMLDCRVSEISRGFPCYRIGKEIGRGRAEM